MTNDKVWEGGERGRARRGVEWKRPVFGANKRCWIKNNLLVLSHGICQTGAACAPARRARKGERAVEQKSGIALRQAQDRQQDSSASSGWALRLAPRKHWRSQWHTVDHPSPNSVRQSSREASPSKGKGTNPE